MTTGGRFRRIESGRLDLVALDLDGTLLDSEFRLSPGNRAALRHVHRKGAAVAIVTGRRYTVACRLLAELDCPHYLVTHAGASINDPSGERLASTPLSPDLLGELLAHAAPFSGHAFLIADRKGRGEILSNAPNLIDPHVRRYATRNEAFLIDAANLASHTRPPILQVVYIGTPGRMRAAMKHLAEFSRSSELTVSETIYPDRDLELLDVVSSGAGKGCGLVSLAALIGVDLRWCMAIGDNFADASMLAVAGYPVVMGNGPPEMRRRWPVTATNDEDGVARALEGIGVGGPESVRT